MALESRQIKGGKVAGGRWWDELGDWIDIKKRIKWLLNFKRYYVIYFKSDVLFSTWSKLGQPLGVFCVNRATWGARIAAESL